MRILIADDERLVRFSLRSMLEELGIPAGSISMARDGQEMLEAVRGAPPDVAFVDIRMPRVNGLDAIRQAGAASPGTRWVILTSHSSFDYARRALQLGAAEYLLKPVSPAELAAVLDKLSRESRCDILRLNDEFEARIVSLLHGTMSMEGEPVEFVSSARFTGCLLVFDSARDEAFLLAGQRECCDRIRARIPSALCKDTRVALGTFPDGQIVLISAWQPAANAGDVDRLRDFLRQTGSLMDSSSGPEVRVTRITGRECSSFEPLLEEFGRMEELAAFRIVAGIGRQIGLEELEEASRRTRETDICACIGGMAQAFRARNRLEFLTFLERAETALSALDKQAWISMESAVSRFLTAAVGAPYPARPADDSWRRALRAVGESLRADDGTAAPRDLADQVVECVGANYMKDIGIGQIASRLGVTPNYLSSVFHREKGTTFVKFLTTLRMEKARAMLEAPGALVQDVARAVGYSSVRHFSRLFQRQYGIYPSKASSVEKNTHES
jgi:two-component system response regulator YesN